MALLVGESGKCRQGSRCHPSAGLGAEQEPVSGHLGSLQRPGMLLGLSTAGPLLSGSAMWQTEPGASERRFRRLASKEQRRECTGALAEMGGLGRQGIRGVREKR